MGVSVHRRLFFFANIGAPLLLGGWYYIAHRPDSYLAQLVGISVTPLIEVPTLLNNYLCDVLWAYSLCIAVYLVMGHVKSALMIACLAETALEIVQLVPAVPGRFDALDILFELIASLTAGAVILFYRRNENEKSK